MREEGADLGDDGGIGGEAEVVVEADEARRAGRDAREQAALLRGARFDFVEDGVAEVFPKRDDFREFAAVREQVPAVETLGAEVARRAETVLEKRAEFVAGERLHGGPFVAVDEDGAVFDDAEIEGLFFVNEPAGVFAEEGAEDFDAAVGGLEIGGRGGGAEKVVVVEIDEAFRDAGDAVEGGLDDVAVEGGLGVGGRHDLVVVDDAQTRVVETQPGGNLRTAGDEIDGAHPRGVELERAEAVAQAVVGVAVTLGVEVAGALGVETELRKVIGARAVHPGVNHIDGGVGVGHGGRHGGEGVRNGGRRPVFFGAP